MLSFYLMNGMFWKPCGVGEISKHYGMGHGSVPCRPLFSLFSHLFVVYYLEKFSLSWNHIYVFNNWVPCFNEIYFCQFVRFCIFLYLRNYGNSVERCWHFFSILFCFKIHQFKCTIIRERSWQRNILPAGGVRRCRLWLLITEPF